MGLLDKLNEVQAAAVQHKNGPLLILSGAGSGKTRVITHRIAYMLAEHGIAPENILAVTFSKKAAQEMKQRLIELIGNRSRHLQVSTFHSLCNRILQENINLIGYNPYFMIYDSLMQRMLIEDIMEMPHLNFGDPDSTLDGISNAKNQFVGPEDYAKVFFDESVAQIYTEYQKELRRNNAVDFDDLIKYSVEIFEANGKVLADYQDRFQYIMVDEYQDTNPSQYKLINMLAQKYQNLCVVGDDDQSIYGFRGADITNILNFEDDYPDALVLKLEQNYRSTQTIVKAANSIIQNNVKRKAKHSWTKNDRGEPIITYEAGSTYSEADYVLRHIQEYVASGYSYSDCAVLYRINSQAQVFEDLFQESSIPYKIVGGSGRYKQGNAVSMMTVHSSKGLEFPIVFLVGVQEGLMPHREASDYAEVEEERRLCYVGVTRAEKILHISWAPARDGQQAVKSRFVDEIPADWRTQQQRMPQVRPQQTPTPQKPPARYTSLRWRSPQTQQAQARRQTPQKQTPPVRQEEKSWQESMQEWRNEKEQVLPVRQAWQDHQRPQEPRTQQKPEGGMCGVIVLACGIVGIFALLAFIFEMFDNRESRLLNFSAVFAIPLAGCCSLRWTMREAMNHKQNWDIQSHT